MVNLATVYLTRRNLLTLLNKLDRTARGDVSACTIIKGDTSHEKYPCTHITTVVAVEDKDYYTDRKPGYVLDAPETDPEIEDAANNHGQPFVVLNCSGVDCEGGDFE